MKLWDVDGAKQILNDYKKSNESDLVDIGDVYYAATQLEAAFDDLKIKFNQLRHDVDTLKLDCGDNSCKFAKNKGGMRTNGGCRCSRNLIHRPPGVAFRRKAHR